MLEGPPGTGKSQTITNLLTHAVAEGKRVLFVAEKRAALDVVQKRLDAVGMGPFSLDLHDKGSKPAAVREQIKRALEHAVAADAQDHAIKTEELRSAPARAHPLRVQAARAQRRRPVAVRGPRRRARDRRGRGADAGARVPAHRRRSGQR